MKRVISLLALLLMLPACGGGGDDVACDQEYRSEEYSTCLPEGWIVLDRETLKQRGIPEEVVAAFQAEEASSGQFPAVIVTREKLAKPVAPADYSEANIRKVSALPGYELLDTQSMTVDAADVSLHVFIVQPVPEEPRRRFYQVSSVESGVGYTITGTGPVSIDDATEGAILLMLRESSFVKPAEE